MARFGAMLKKRLFIFLLLSTLLFSALFLFLWQKRAGSTPVYLVYTVIAETTPTHARHFTVGSRLTDAKAKGAAGEILAVTQEKTVAEDAHGVYVRGDRVTLSLRIAGEGKRRGGEVGLTGFVPRVGERVYLYSDARIEGLCVRVRALNL